MFPKIIHSYVFLAGLVLLAVGINLSPFLTSVAQFVLAGNWIFEFNFKQKIATLKTRFALQALLSIFFLHIIWLCSTTNFDYALHDIKIKLLLLAFPLILGTSRALTKNEFKSIFIFFVIGCIISSIIGLAKYIGFWGHEITDVRQISVFISHIRFSILLNIAIFGLFYFLNSKTSELTKLERIFFRATLVWLILFMFVLQALTGIIILLVVSYILLLHYIFRLENKKYKLINSVALLLIPLFFITFVGFQTYKFYNPENNDFNEQKIETISGNKYTHYEENKMRENGYFVWRNVCYTELEREWAKRSQIKIAEKDKQGNKIYYTLVRYLSSRGLTKDSVGISKLSVLDVENIENGLSNYRFINKNLATRVYRIIWQIDVYRIGENPSGHSITQRLEFWKIGLAIIKENFWQGTGTGDLNDAYAEMYVKQNSLLKEAWRFRSHNQFISIFAAFGFFGFAWFIFALISPIYYEKKSNDFFIFIFIISAILSMINEDTLETQAGATYFAFFYSFFLFSRNTKIS